MCDIPRYVHVDSTFQSVTGTASLSEIRGQPEEERSRQSERAIAQLQGEPRRSPVYQEAERACLCQRLPLHR